MTPCLNNKTKWQDESRHTGAGVPSPAPLFPRSPILKRQRQIGSAPRSTSWFFETEVSLFILSWPPAFNRPASASQVLGLQSQNTVPYFPKDHFCHGALGSFYMQHLIWGNTICPRLRNPPTLTGVGPQRVTRRSVFQKQPTGRELTPAGSRYMC